MYQPNWVTLRVQPETEAATFVKRLAAAIVLRAIQDLLSSNNEGPADSAGLSDRAMSQEWIFGEGALRSLATRSETLNPSIRVVDAWKSPLTRL
jgi:hypothetical protein